MKRSMHSRRHGWTGSSNGTVKQDAIAVVDRACRSCGMAGSAMDVLNDKEFQLRQEDAVMEPSILQVRIESNERHSIFYSIPGSTPILQVVSEYVRAGGKPPAAIDMLADSYVGQ